MKLLFFFCTFSYIMYCDLLIIGGIMIQEIIKTVSERDPEVGAAIAAELARAGRT